MVYTEIMNIPSRVAERAATRFTIEGECHISTYSRIPQGYAQIGWQEDDGTRRGTVAHRAAWTHYVGRQIPEGIEIDHIDSCRNRPCVRREHLRELDALDNARRNGRGRDFPVGWLCKSNHPSSEQMQIKRKNKKGETRMGWTCKACTRESQAKYTAKDPERVRQTKRDSAARMRGKS
jgi:hypothetical protein